MFLDEISQLEPPAPGRAPPGDRNGKSARLGGSRGPSTSRFIAASSANLAQAVNHGAFREDLFYRLNVVPIHLPPLRERKEDIPLLVDHFLKKYGRKAGKAVAAVSTRAMLVLTEYDWPGNIRELDNTIERAVVLARGRAVEVDDLMSHGISMGIPALAWAGGTVQAAGGRRKGIHQGRPPRPEREPGPDGGDPGDRPQNALGEDQKIRPGREGSNMRTTRAKDPRDRRRPGFPRGGDGDPRLGLVRRRHRVQHRGGDQRILAEKPDLILLDIMMDSLFDGYSLCHAIRNTEKFAAAKTTPIIFVSAVRDSPARGSGSRARTRG